MPDRGTTVYGPDGSGQWRGKVGRTWKKAGKPKRVGYQKINVDVKS